MARAKNARWLCDTRVRCVAVYQEPERTCLSFIEDDPRCVFSKIWLESEDGEPCIAAARKIADALNEARAMLEPELWKVGDLNLKTTKPSKTLEEILVSLSSLKDAAVLHYQYDLAAAIRAALDEAKKIPEPDDARTKLAKELYKIACKAKSMATIDFDRLQLREAYMQMADFIELREKRAVLAAINDVGGCFCVATNKGCRSGCSRCKGVDKLKSEIAVMEAENAS